MASPPTVVTGRRRQHELLRSWTFWPLTSILIDPAAVAHVRDAVWSGTHHRHPETGERIVGTADGLGFGVDGSWHNPVEVIPWSELEAIARAVPDEVREQLIGFQGSVAPAPVRLPRFTASAAAVGCGRIVAGAPLTARQEAHVGEHEAFEASGVLSAWERQRAQLDAERLGLHGQAMGLSAGSEAGDLLELLSDQQLGTPIDRDPTTVRVSATPGEGRTQVARRPRSGPAIRAGGSGVLLQRQGGAAVHRLRDPGRRVRLGAVTVAV